jgi:hypothetical protein
MALKQCAVSFTDPTEATKKKKLKLLLVQR